MFLSSKRAGKSLLFHGFRKICIFELEKKKNVSEVNNMYIMNSLLKKTCVEKINIAYQINHVVCE